MLLVFPRQDFGQDIGATGWFDCPPRPAAANAPLASLAGGALASRFHAWRGRSGRRYICSVFAVLDMATETEFPNYSDAVIIAAAAEENGRRRMIAIGQSGSNGAWFGHSAFARMAISAGATEWHVHLLAASRAARHAVRCDLEAAAKA